MTIEQQLYGPPWVKCALCGVVQPLEAVSIRKPAKFLQCINDARCARQADEVARELSEFARSHPELNPKAGK